MLQIRRLNMDTSWQLQWGQTILLIDPWLQGSEIDGFAWFNEQWHTVPPISIDLLGVYHAIVISQPFSDHCHEETLHQLNSVPLLVNPKAKKRLVKEFGKREIETLPLWDKKEWLRFGNVDIAYLKSSKVLSAAFDAILIRNEHELIVYCPHGFELTLEQQTYLSRYQVKALIVGFSSFELPFFLGGVVNPGKTNALELAKVLNPQTIFHTHDENKASKGIVKRIAKIKYPTVEEMKEELEAQFVFLGQAYEWYSIVS